jgi:hypothetical protein
MLNRFTDSAWAGTCRQFIIKFKDETEYMAKFQSKR